MNKRSLDGITVDTESVTKFVSLVEKEEWSDEDLDRFVSTEGIQYIIQQEKEPGPNYSEDTVKSYLRKVKSGLSGEFGGWETAWKEKTRMKKRLEYIFYRWSYLVERPFSVVREYLPYWKTIKGVFYILPGGIQKSYSSPEGFGINLGCRDKSDTHWMLSFARECYLFYLIHIRNEKPHITECRAPLDFVRVFLDLTMRDGMALLVGLKAAGIEEQFYNEQLPHLEKAGSLYGEAFQMALDGRALMEAENIQKKVFTGYASPCALLGFQIARAVEESDSRIGHSIAKEMLLGSVGTYVPFFEICEAYGKHISNIPQVVWKAFKQVRRETDTQSVTEDYTFPT